MDEYIKREAALALVKPDVPEDEKAAVTIGTAKKLIRNIVRRTPAADVAPVVHGRWKLLRKGDWTSAFVCSVCGRRETIAESESYNSQLKMPRKYPYCHCGARMDDGACKQVCKYNTPDRGCVAGELGARCDLANVAGERGNGEAG